MSDTWIKFFPSDWLSGTVGLTAMEKGVYITILALIYDRGGPIPNNPRVLARRCDTTPAAFRNALETLVQEGKLIVSSDEISNKKAEKIIADAEQRIEKARKGGYAKAGKKTEENQHNSSAQAEDEQRPGRTEAVLDGCSTPAIPEPEPEPEKKKASKLAQKVRLEGQPTDAPSSIDKGIEADLRHAANWFHDAPRLSHVKPIEDLIAQGLSLHDDIIPTLRQLAPNVEHRTSWTYFLGPLEDILRRRTGKAPDTPAKPDPAQTTTRREVWVWKDTAQWAAWSAGRPRPWPTSEQRHPDGGRRQGWYFPSEWPPGYEGSGPPAEPPPRATADAARTTQTA